jgi:hypothetical protein
MKTTTSIPVVDGSLASAVLAIPGDSDMKAELHLTPAHPKSSDRRGRFFAIFNRFMILVPLVLGPAAMEPCVCAQELPASGQADLSVLQWPRYHATNGYEFVIYQPQISSWPSNELNGRFVVGVQPAGTSNQTYGVVFFQARTDIDKVNRLVTLDDLQITKLNFPNAKENEDQYRDMLLSFRSQAVKVIPLDHLEAVFAASTDIANAKAQAVKNDAPQIFYSTRPALLVLVDGPPIMGNANGDYQRVINTRAILLFDNNPQYQGYYLYADNQWYSAPALDGPWAAPANSPPNIDNALAAALATKQVDPLYPRNPDAPSVKQIYVSDVPAELLQTDGTPNLLSVSGTDLMYVENSGNAIFFDPDDSNYYVLVSGRWFKSASLQGPWAFVPPGSLPGDFKKIPPDSDKSNVLMSVAGTPQAQEAVIANSIPQTATVQRDQASPQISYYGDPNFTPIPGTDLSYATNSDTPVVMIAPNNYYACQDGVWFQSAAAQGPWAVATSVPAVIYAIPASCPIHYVTYAYVYGSTPSTVNVGYTPGYMGTVVAPGGVVVYGTGYDYPATVVGDTYVGYPPTYGYGASFALGAAVGYSFGYCAGSASTCWTEPYWGCYHWAAPAGYSYAHCNVNGCNFYTHWGSAVTATGSYGYNPYTGREYASRSAATFNPYTGAHGTASSGAAYNPYTGNAAAARGGSYYNPSTGRYASGDTTVSGNAYNDTASRSSSGTAGNTKTGNSVSWNNGNVTADKDGNIYSYNNQTAQAQKYNGSTGNWESASRPASTPANNANAYASNYNYQRESAAQETGAQRYNSYAQAGGGGYGGYRGGARR